MDALVDVTEDTSATSSALPEHNASAIVGEIYAALVIQSTLGAEIQRLEAEVALSAAANYADGASAEELQWAAEEALALAAHERGLRQSAQSKLRCLQAEKLTEAGTQDRLEEQRKLVLSKDRELKDARAKANRAAERHAAATHGLRSERQQARQQRRSHGARSVVRLAHELWIVERLRRGFLVWRAKVVDAGIFEIAHAPPPRAWHAAGSSSERVAALHQRNDDELAYEAQAAALHARDAENRALRERVASLENSLALDQAREEALRRAAERAGTASALLLEARRENIVLNEELAAAKAALARRALHATR